MSDGTRAFVEGTRCGKVYGFQFYETRIDVLSVCLSKWVKDLHFCVKICNNACSLPAGNDLTTKLDVLLGSLKKLLREGVKQRKIVDVLSKEHLKPNKSRKQQQQAHDWFI